MIRGWLCLVSFCVVMALENGRARTPPMGWMAWGRFLCQIDCTTDKPCINETLFISVARHLVNDGYRDAGYDRVHIDDCWMEKNRSRDEHLLADRNRFPNGIDGLARMIRELGLHFAMYLTYGHHSCMGFAGTWSEAQIRNDAVLIGRIGADYLKFDGCFNRWQDLERGYLSMGAQLAQLDDPVVYACSWPFYLLSQQKPVDYAAIAAACNVWRNYNDIEMKWQSVLSIIAFYTYHQDELAKYHGPGHWNDPDMLIIGNAALTPEQERVQMSFWCLWSAPLIMSNDLNSIPATSRRILLNKHAISVNQDVLGDFGIRVESINNVDYYLKHLADPYSFALLLFNRNKQQVPAELSPTTLGLYKKLGGTRFKFFNIWTEELIVASNKQIQMPGESVQFYIVSGEYVGWPLMLDFALFLTIIMIVLCLFEARAVKVVSRSALSKLRISYFVFIVFYLAYSLAEYLQSL